MYVSWILIAICTVLVYCSLPMVQGVRPRFRTFEDYLQHLDKKLQSSIIQLGRESNVSSTTTLATVKAAKGNLATTNNAISTHSSEDEEKNITCCVLGELAGDKGFHCYAEFYAARIVLRNINRAHTKKLGFHGRFKIAGYGERLMKTFEQCVAGHGHIFHKCCHLATMEKNASKRQQQHTQE